jgi:succinoglycan biosynthesis protein ExoA
VSPANRLLIVIPCLNEEAHLATLLDQFGSENPDALIVVADGGSTDRSRAIVLDRAKILPNVILVDNPRQIQAAAVNLGVERYGSNFDWLLRADAHCEYPPNYAGRLIEAAHLWKAASVVVPMVSQGTGIFQIAAATAQNSLLGTGGSPHRRVGKGGYVDHGHHALMDLKAFQAIGGYREDMIANEDAELDLRLSAVGRIWLEPRLAIIYYPRSSPSRLWGQYFKHGAGRARTLLLHRVRPKLRQLLPVAVAAAAILAVLTPAWPWFAVPALAWLCFTLLAGILVGLRSGKPAGLLAGFAAAIMHLSWGLGFIVAAVRYSRSQPNLAGRPNRSVRPLS